MTTAIQHPEVLQLQGKPFRDQMQWIQTTLPHHNDLPNILHSVAQWPDPDPLAEAIRVLGTQRLLHTPQVLPVLRAFFATLPDVSLQRCLQVLDEIASTTDLHTAIPSLARDALRQTPMSRVTAFCLLARWWKQHDRTSYQNHLDDAYNTLLNALQSNTLDDLDDWVWMSLPGPSLFPLLREARSHSLTDALQTHLNRTCETVLHHLQHRPRSLSQANAEDLLARRIYTDPGHFLVELLQNAEDAQASHFEIHITDQFVAVVHNGAPFDVRDVVGVLSIGQTTKTSEHIGFFGVGFKSIYEVCDRPQVYSDWFRFEIADISIPRPLYEAPKGPWDDSPAVDPSAPSTLLILPLRDPSDPLRSPDALAAKALSFPPETLLTLTHLSTLRVVTPHETRTVSIQRDDANHRATLTHAEHNTTQTCATFWETSEPTHPVLIAVALDKDDAPIPFDLHTPTFFSHLPTGEHLPIQPLIHARFEVPVDRERLHRSSQRNTSLLTRAGKTIAHTAHALASPSSHAHLDVLPHPKHLHDPFHKPLWDACQTHARTLPLFPTPSTATPLLPASQTLLLERAGEPYIPLFASCPSLPHEKTLLSPLSPDHASHALSLGATPITLLDIADHLHTLCLHPTPPFTTWLQTHNHAILEAFASALLSIRSKTQRSDLLNRLSTLPIFPSQNHSLHTPSTVYRVGSQRAFRSLYTHLHPLLPESLDLSTEVALRSLLNELAFPKLDAQTLLHDLSDPTTRTRILTPENDAALLDIIALQPPQRLRAFATLPIFRDTHNTLRPLQGPLHERAFLPPTSPSLRDLLDHTQALHVLSAHPDHDTTYQALHAEHASLRLLVQALTQDDQPPASPDLCQRLLDALNNATSDLTLRDRDTLSRAPLFLDTTSTPRPLLGPARVLLPADATIPTLLPTLPWAHPSLLASPFVQSLSIPHVGPQALVQTLTKSTSNPLTLDLSDPDTIEQLHRYLLQFTPSLSSDDRARLIAQPLWLDHNRTLRPLHDLRQPSNDPELEALLSLWEPRQPVHSLSLQLASALSCDQNLQSPSLSSWLGVLSPSDLETFLELDRPATVQLLLRCATTLSPTDRAPLYKLPFLRSQTPSDTSLYRPAPWSALDPSSSTNRPPIFRPSPSLLGALALSSVALLHPDDEATFGPLLDALDILPSTLSDLVHILSTTSLIPVQSNEDLLRTTLLQHLPDQPAIAPQTLGALPIWTSTQHTFHTAHTLTILSDLLDLLPPTTHSALDAPHPVAFVDPDLLATLQRLDLSLPFVSPSSWLHTHLSNTLLPNTSLHQQPAPWRSLEDLAFATHTLVKSGVDVSDLPIWLDTSHTLRTAPLPAPHPAISDLLEPLNVASRAVDLTYLDLSGLPAQPLPIRPVLDALYAVSRTPQPISSHPVLSSSEARDALHCWLLDTGEEFAGQPELLPVLRKAAIVPTLSGQLCPPKDLLFTEDLQRQTAAALTDLSALDDYRPHHDLVPAEVLSLYRDLTLLDRDTLTHIVSLLVDLHKTHQSSQDGPASALVLTAISETLSRAFPDLHDPEVSSILERLKARKLRIETMNGEFMRISRVFALGVEHARLLHQCLQDPPPCAHPRYRHANLHPLLIAAGSPSHLDDDTITSLLENPKLLPSNPQAPLAFARLVALHIHAFPDLLKPLKLDSRPWVPNRLLTLRKPAELVRPTPDNAALVGSREDIFPHALWGETIPPTVLERLPLRDTDALTLDEVFSAVPPNTPASPTLLQWLEDNLRAKRIDHDRTRTFFSQTPRILSDDGALCTPAQLVCSDTPTDDPHNPRASHLSPPRSVWSQGLRLSKLAAVLRVPKTPADTLAPSKTPAQPTPTNPPTPETSTPNPKPEPSVWNRVKRWFGSDEDETPTPPTTDPTPQHQPPNEPKPFNPTPRDHTRWFTPQRSINPQLQNNHSDWLQSRREQPQFGFLFEPANLDIPYRYAPNLIAARFERRSQRWLPTSSLKASWMSTSPGPYTLTMRGRLPRGSVHLPRPICAHLHELCDPQGTPIPTATTRNGLLLASLSQPSEVSLSFSLQNTPTWTHTEDAPPDLPKELLQTTTRDNELPDAVHDAIAWIQHTHTSLLNRAIAVRDFIRSEYTYDPIYFEDPALGRWLKRTTRGRSNVHIAILHATADVSTLGRGVCYELNALACELLRRVGVPAAVSTGWTLSGGTLSEPDHMWAMALLPTERNALCWLPLDASVTQDGRPLSVGAHPPLDLSQTSAPPPQAQAPPSTIPDDTPQRWDRRTNNTPTVSTPRHTPRSTPRRSSSARKASKVPLSELLRVLRHAQDLTGSSSDQESTELLDACRQALNSPDFAKRLLDMISKSS